MAMGLFWRPWNNAGCRFIHALLFQEEEMVLARAKWLQ